MAEKVRTLTDTLNFLSKELEVVADLSGMDKSFPHVSTGSYVLDILSGIGGFPVGRITELAGEYSSGKTTVALHAAAKVQKEGGVVLYADFEQALDVNYAASLGVDITDVREGGKFILLTPDSLEDGWQAIHTILKHGEVKLVVLDSISAMTPKSMFNEELEVNARLGSLAAALAPHLQKMVDECQRINCATIALNQIRTKFIPTQYGMKASKDTSGGNAPKFYSSMIIWLDIVGQIEGTIMDEIKQESIKAPVVNKVRAFFKKNKMARPLLKGEFYIRYGSGVDNLLTLIDVAVEKDIISLSGSYYAIKGTEKRLQGLESVRQHLLVSPKLVESIAREIGWDFELLFKNL